MIVGNNFWAYFSKIFFMQIPFYNREIIKIIRSNNFSIEYIWSQWLVHFYVAYINMTSVNEFDGFI